MREKSLSIDGTSIAYQYYPGDDALTPIFYIHGWLDNAASFSPLVPLLANHPGYAFDLPGHGHSSHLPAFGYYHFIDGVSLSIAFMKAITERPFILVGHSLGGCLASIIAGSIPEQIEKLILLDAIGPLTTDADQCAIQYQKYLKQHAKVKQRRPHNYPSITAACKHRASQGYISEANVQAIVERGIIEDAKHQYNWRHDPRLLLPSPLKMSQTQVLAFLTQISAPTLLLNASKGFKFNEAHYQQRIAAIDNIKVHTIDAGHHLHIEAAQQCAEYINDFIPRC